MSTSSEGSPCGSANVVCGQGINSKSSWKEGMSRAAEQMNLLFAMTAGRGRMFGPGTSCTQARRTTPGAVNQLAPIAGHGIGPAPASGIPRLISAFSHALPRFSAFWPRQKDFLCLGPANGWRPLGHSLPKTCSAPRPAMMRVAPQGWAKAIRAENALAAVGINRGGGQSSRRSIGSN